MDLNANLFKNVSFSDLMNEVYQNSKKKDRQITKLISKLEPLIKTASDATIVVPLIKEYMDIAVKNDDHVVKLTAIVQRYINTQQSVSSNELTITDSERDQLLKIAEENFQEELTDSVKEIKEAEKLDNDINTELKSVKQKLRDVGTDRD